jgi:hypothetical protein
MDGLHVNITKTFKESFSCTAETPVLNAINTHITPLIQTVGKSSPKACAKAATTSNQGTTHDESQMDSGDDNKESDGDFQPTRRKCKHQGGEVNLLHVRTNSVYPLFLC